MALRKLERETGEAPAASCEQRLECADDPVTLLQAILDDFTFSGTGHVFERDPLTVLNFSPFDAFFSVRVHLVKVRVYPIAPTHRDGAS